MRHFLGGFAILLTLLPALAAAQVVPQPWNQVGPTVSLSVSNSSSSAKLGWATVGATPPIAERVCNTGAVAASVAFGDSAVVATTVNFSIPPGTTSVPSCVVLAGGSAAYIAAITATGTTTLTISSGSGWVMGSGAAAGSATAVINQIATNADLAAAANATYPNGVWRIHYAAGGVADGPLFFMPQTGTCAANSLVNDGGDCVDGAGGNSWKAVHKNGIYNLREFGAKGDGTTDDYTAIQNWLTAAGANGLAYAPQGTYCDKTAALTISASNAHVVGAGMNQTQFSACGADVAVMSSSAFQLQMSDLAIEGSQVLTTTHDALAISGNQTRLSDMQVVWGHYNINISSVDNHIDRLRINSPYGSAALNLANGSGVYISKTNFDFNYPAGLAGAGSDTIPARANTTAYAAGKMVTDGNYYLQATVGGTSGGSAPTLLGYGQNITDGTVTWQLAGPYYGGAGSLITSNANVALYVHNCDLSAPAALGIYYVGVGGQAVVSDSVISTIFVGANATSASYDLTINGTQIADSPWNQGTGITVSGAGGGSLKVGGGTTIFGMQRDIWLTASGHHQIVGTDLEGASLDAIDIAAGVTGVIVDGNNLGTGIHGANANALVVETGASDYYNITNNIVHGATAGITDGGTGTHKTILGNN